MALFDTPQLHDFPDRAIRELLQRTPHLQQLVQSAAPAVAPLLDFDRAVNLGREFPMPDWRRSECDVIFDVPFRAPEAERAALVCVLIEHQSGEDQAMPLRTLLYTVLYWEREWRAWSSRPHRGEPLRLNPVLPIIFHTGGEPWRTNRTLADLFAAAEPLRGLVPSWQPVFWDLAEQTPQGLLDAAGEWLNVLAVVRATREDREAYEAVQDGLLRRLEPLAERDKMRWLELLWFIFSWAEQRRPRAELPRLHALAESSTANVALREEIRAMAQTVSDTWAEWAQRRYSEGEAQGALRASKDNLRTFLEGRFGPLPEALVQQIEALTDLNRLKASVRQAGRIHSLDELQL
jgi:hypothetical protein